MSVSVGGSGNATKVNGRREQYFAGETLKRGDFVKISPNLSAPEYTAYNVCSGDALERQQIIGGFNDKFCCIFSVDGTSNGKLKVCLAELDQNKTIVYGTSLMLSATCSYNAHGCRLSDSRLLIIDMGIIASEYVKVYLLGIEGDTLTLLHTCSLGDNWCLYGKYIAAWSETRAFAYVPYIGKIFSLSIVNDVISVTAECAEGLFNNAYTAGGIFLTDDKVIIYQSGASYVTALIAYKIAADGSLTKVAASTTGFYHDNFDTVDDIIHLENGRCCVIGRGYSSGGNNVAMLNINGDLIKTGTVTRFDASTARIASCKLNAYKVSVSFANRIVKSVTLCTNHELFFVSESNISSNAIMYFNTVQNSANKISKNEVMVFGNASNNLAAICVRHNLTDIAKRYYNEPLVVGIVQYGSTRNELVNVIESK